MIDANLSDDVGFALFGDDLATQDDCFIQLFCLVIITPKLNLFRACALTLVGDAPSLRCCL